MAPKQLQDQQTVAQAADGGEWFHLRAAVSKGTEECSGSGKKTGKTMELYCLNMFKIYYNIYIYIYIYITLYNMI